MSAVKELHASLREDQLVALPHAPITASPVPWLTSIHSTPGRGHYGDARYPGNCSGKIIRDLLLFFQPRNVLDPMTGSGTCRDVCRELRLPCYSGDIRTGFDACDASSYPAEKYDFVWLHPPYWRMKKYTQDPRDLSGAPTMEDFYKRLYRLLVAASSKLSENGRMAVLMGDYQDMAVRRFIPCTHMVRHICLQIGLWPACTEIIRFQHGNSSSNKTYSSSFIPGLHDTCMIFGKK